MIPDIIIGIDPGSTNGGIAVWKINDPVKVIKMPPNNDLNAMSDYFKYIKSLNCTVVCFVEKISMFLGSEDANNPAIQYRLQSLKANYERILAFLVYNDIPYVPVHPMSWQSSLKLRKKWDSDKEKKNAFKTYAQNCFPEIRVSLWSSDALCLVQFALRKYDTDISWINERIENTKKGLF